MAILQLSNYKQVLQEGESLLVINCIYNLFVVCINIFGNYYYKYYFSLCHKKWTVLVNP